jgi:hypothetical protein
MSTGFEISLRGGSAMNDFCRNKQKGFFLQMNTVFPLWVVYVTIDGVHQSLISIAFHNAVGQVRLCFGLRVGTADTTRHVH